MTGALHAPSTTARLTTALAAAPEHLRPIILAVRDHRVGMLFVGQDAASFRIPNEPKRRAAVVILGDDMDKSMGPEGFHLPSVRRVICACRVFAVVSSAAPCDVYAAMGAAAVLGRNALIVETRLEHEFQWVSLIQKLAPGRPIIIATVKGGTA